MYKYKGFHVLFVSCFVDNYLSTLKKIFREHISCKRELFFLERIVAKDWISQTLLVACFQFSLHRLKKKIQKRYIYILLRNSFHLTNTNLRIKFSDSTSFLPNLQTEDIFFIFFSAIWRISKFAFRKINFYFLKELLHG